MKKIKLCCYWIVFKRKKTQYFTCFYILSYFKLSETIRLNSTHYVIMKIPNKREIQQIASNNSSDIDFKDFMKLSNDYPEEPYSF